MEARGTSRPKKRESYNIDDYFGKEKAEKNKWYERPKKLITDISVGVDNLFKNISPKLEYKVKVFEANKIRKETENLKKIDGFDKAMEKLYKINKKLVKKDVKNDFSIFDVALKNRDVKVQNEIATKYGFQNELDNLRKFLNDIRTEATDAGIRVGYIEDYFPRMLNPELKNQFYEFIIKDKAKFGELIDIIALAKEKKPNMTESEELKFINNYFRGFMPQGLMPLSANNNLRKSRDAINVAPELNKFFLDSKIALSNYVRATTDDIEVRKFFGVESIETKDKRQALTSYYNRRKSLDNQLNNYLNSLSDNQQELAQDDDIDNYEYEDTTPEWQPSDEDIQDLYNEKEFEEYSKLSNIEKEKIKEKLKAERQAEKEKQKQETIDKKRLRDEQRDINKTYKQFEKEQVSEQKYNEKLTAREQQNSQIQKDNLETQAKNIANYRNAIEELDRQIAQIELELDEDARVDNSIGKFVEDLGKEQNISKADLDLIKRGLNAIFNPALLLGGLK